MFKDYESVFKKPDRIILIVSIAIILMSCVYLYQQYQYQVLINMMFKNACFSNMFYNSSQVVPFMQN